MPTTSLLPAHARRLGAASVLALAGLLVLGPTTGRGQPARRDPWPVARAQAAFRLPPGLRIELVAAEPLVQSPVAIDFDEDGRLWVVEMQDYPNGPPRGQPPQGRVRILEDRDGDGIYEHSRVFADHLLFANGLLPWKDGAVVTAAPHIVWLRDKGGTGRADTREVLYEGFAAENPQLRVNHPVLGLDGWVYVANGLRGGRVARASGAASARRYSPREQPINLSGRDFRFDLIGGGHEAISGMGQYGNCFDDWGRRFVCDNRHHLRHIVLPDRALAHNPYLAVRQVLQDTSELPLGEAGAGAKIYPLSKNWTTSNLHAGRFTAACSVFIYRGNLLPAEYRGCAFTCDPTGNLVHQEVLTAHGASFRSRPPRAGVEFLASPDDWFRPVFLALGPDGALYVVDMCRAVIEHPEFMPPELQKRPDLAWGKDKGRIWRIVPDDGHAKMARPRLSRAPTGELVKLLGHPNAWWRTTAQRLLLQRQDRSAVEPLRQLVLTAGEPRARLHASWLLKSFGALDERLLDRLLHSPQPELLENAVRLAEPRLEQSAVLRGRVMELAAHADGRVRFQVALSLGACKDAAVLRPLAAILDRGRDDPWTRAAVATAVPDRAGVLTAEYLRLARQPGKSAPAGAWEAMRELTGLVGARRDRAEVAQVIGTLLDLAGPNDAPWQMAGMEGLATGMARRGERLGDLLKTLPPSQQAIGRRMGDFLGRCAALAAEGKGPPAQRLAAVHLLAHAPWETARPVLVRLLDDSSQSLRLAAVWALAEQRHPEVAGLLLQTWRRQTPAVRRELAEAVLRQPARIRALLDAVEAGKVPPGDLDAVRVRQLLQHQQADIRERARKLLQPTLPADRKEVVARYRPALRLKGDPLKGREVFKQNCATCHRVAGLGIDVGPDISDSRTKTAEALLTDILNPNQAIDNNYVNYVVTTRAGKVLTGIIAAETAGSITLGRAGGQMDVVLRQDVEEIVSSGVSLMPEGLEKNISLRDMADLLDFLKNWRYLTGAVPGVGPAGQ